jgi:hypothetical protein
MPFKAGIVEAKGNSVSVFLVHHSVLSCPERAQNAFDRLRRQFPHLPVCLVAKDPGGTIIYHAALKTRELLGDLDLSTVDWMELEGQVA